MAVAEDETARVFTISLRSLSEEAIGETNEAFKDNCCEGNLSKPETTSGHNTLGLDLSDEEFEVEENTDNRQISCIQHQQPAIWFCVDCCSLICTRCKRVHHSTHETVLGESLAGDRAGISNAYTRYMAHAQVYKAELLKQVGSLDNTLSLVLKSVEQAYGVVLSKVAEKKKESLCKVKAAISSQRQILNEKLNNNQHIIDTYTEALSADSSVTALDERWLKQLPANLVVPTTSLTADVPLQNLTIPEVTVQLSSSSTVLPIEHTNSITNVRLSHISTVGSKGQLNLEFKYPGGLCLDLANNVYVADEGNNRIQKISNDGQCLDVFMWEANKTTITGLAYDPSSNRLLVPRAYNDHGLLKCSEFSYVTLEGEEVGRFVVPGMQGGLFVYCGEDGAILISDVVKKSVFLIKDDHVYLEIRSSEHLKQPSFATFGIDGEILVVDCGRKVVAVFDRNGSYIRDIGVQSEELTLKKPCGIAIDKSCGIVAVTDWCADKLVLFSYQGKVLAATEGFRCPHSVAINGNHRLVVSDCWNNQIKVFSYDLA